MLTYSNVLQAEVKGQRCFRFWISGLFSLIWSVWMSLMRSCRCDSRNVSFSIAGGCTDVPLLQY